MWAASAWHCEQVLGRFSGYTGDKGSRAARISCTPWQSMQVATPASPFARCWPCTLVAYSEFWSTRSEGLYFRMKFGSLWHRAQSFGTAVRGGTPTYPWALLMEASGSSELGSPPWQAAHVNPCWKCTLFRNAAAGACRSPVIWEWHSKQESFPGNRAAASRRRRSAYFIADTPAGKMSRDRPETPLRHRSPVWIAQSHRGALPKTGVRPTKMPAGQNPGARRPPLPCPPRGRVSTSGCRTAPENTTPAESPRERRQTHRPSGPIPMETQPLIFPGVRERHTRP